LEVIEIAGLLHLARQGMAVFTVMDTGKHKSNNDLQPFTVRNQAPHLEDEASVISGTCRICCSFYLVVTKPFDSLKLTPRTLAAISANGRLTWQIQ
jgi:hypothetical protein